MKYLILLLLILVQLNGFTQSSRMVSPDMQLIKLSENAYIHVTWSSMPGFGRFASNGLIFINGKEAFLFDTPATDSLTSELVSWIQQSMNLKIAGFIPNHWHNDCMGGLGFLQANKIKSYAHQKTLEMARSKHLPVPNQGFNDSLQLRLGDKEISCYYLGAAHSQDNIVVWIPSEKILFAGCMIKSLDSGSLGNTADGDLNAYPATIEKLINKFPAAKIVIPGHGQYGGTALIRHTKELSVGAAARNRPGR